MGRLLRHFRRDKDHEFLLLGGMPVLLKPDAWEPWLDSVVDPCALQSLLVPLDEADSKRIKELTTNLENVWHAPTRTMAERKTLLRFLIKRVYLDGVTEVVKIHINVEQHTGAHTAATIDRLKVGIWAPKTPVDAVERIRELHTEGLDYGAIAQRLNDEGFRSAKGFEYDDKVVGYVARTRGWGHKSGKSDKYGKA
jgi:hypothetical protein